MKHELPPGTLVLAKLDSHNEKLGRAATTYAAQVSCPRECVFFDGGGCYAEDGPLGKFVTAPLNRAAAHGDASPLAVARAEARAIDDLVLTQEVGRPLRVHTVGDCPDDECANIVARACERYMERGGGPCWTYTHAWRVVERRSWGLVSVLASCETAEDVGLAHERGYATAITVESFPSEKLYEIGGRVHRQETERGGVAPPGDPERRDTRSVSVLPCPAQTRSIPCTECRLCFRDGARHAADVTIGFAIHGTRFLQRKARLALERPDDPNRKLTSRELIPRFEEEFRARNGREPTTAEIAAGIDMHPSSVWEMMKSLRTGKPTVKKPHHRERSRR